MRIFTLLFVIVFSFGLYASTLKDHPRLLFPMEQEALIQEKIKENKWQTVLHNRIIEEANVLLTSQPLKYQLTGMRLLAVSREALDRIFYLGYAYRITRQDEYLKRAQDELLAVCSFQDWNPIHFLDVAEMSAAVSLGYDWLYGRLDPVVAQIVKQAIYEKALLPSEDPVYGYWLNKVSNWNQVCSSGILLGALAIYEENPEKCESLIQRSISSVRDAMPAYAPDGNYQEGYAYWEYGTSYSVAMIDALQTNYGTQYNDLITTPFLKSAYYFLNMVGSSTKAFNYGDCVEKSYFASTILWFADYLQDPTILWNQQNFLTPTTLIYEANIVPALLWGIHLDLSNLHMPEQKAWSGEGLNPVALLRSSWDKSNAIFTAIKGGKALSPHAHMDIGSFVLDVNSIRWISDLGPEDYAKMEAAGVDLWNFAQTSTRWDLMRCGITSHNIITFDGTKQNVEGNGDLVGSSDRNPMFRYAIMNLDPVYEGQVNSERRGVSIVNNQYLMVQDEIKTGGSGRKMTLNFCTPRTVSYNPTLNLFELAYQSKKVYVEIKGLKNFTYYMKSAKPATDYENPNTGYTLFGFEANLLPNTDYRVQVRFIPSENYENNRNVIDEPLANWNLIVGEADRIESKPEELFSVATFENEFLVQRSSAPGILYLFTAEGYPVSSYRMETETLQIEIPKGVFILRFVSDEGRVQVKKIYSGKSS